MKALPRLAAHFFFGIAILSSTTLCFAQPVNLVETLVPETLGLDKGISDRLKLIRKSKSVKLAIAFNARESALLSDSMKISTPNGKVLSLVRSRLETRTKGELSWFGKTSDGGDATFYSTGGQISGRIVNQGKVYEVRNVTNRMHVLIEIDTSLLPPEHSASHPDGSAPELTSPIQIDENEHDGLKDSSSSVESVGDFKYIRASSASASASASTISGASTIDVLVAYTPQAAQYLGNINSASQAAINLVNESFTNSGVNLFANLAGTTLLNAEFSKSEEALLGLYTAPGPAILRDYLKADAIILIAHSDTKKDCGLAKTFGATPTTAFAMVFDECLIANMSMTHELGHLFGARHDFGNDQTNWPYAYGHGFSIKKLKQNQLDYYCLHTIMSYPAGCPAFTPDPRINYWSDPQRTVNLYGVNWVIGDFNSSAVSVVRLAGPAFAQFGETQIASIYIKRMISAVTTILLLD